MSGNSYLSIVEEIKETLENQRLHIQEQVERIIVIET